MSAIAVRHGATKTPTVTDAGTPGTDDNLLTFTNPVRPVIVSNDHATVRLYIKFNASPATIADYDYILLPGTSVKMDNIQIKTVSLFLSAGVYADDTTVRGWES